jgi:hypothetical protein
MLSRDSKGPSSGMSEVPSDTSNGAKTGGSTRGRLLRVAVVLVSVTASIAGVLTLSTLSDPDPSISSEWPRPFDPAKPFNMLGVPGVSVEQRKRAEDLLVRSLEAAPRWADHGQLLKEGWEAIPEQIPGFDKLIRYDYLVDGRMLDPLYPESLVYRVKDGERTFVAYMFISEQDVDLDDPFSTDFAGRLLEWHNHSDLCWLGDELAAEGGDRYLDSCPADADVSMTLDPRVLTGEVPDGTYIRFESFLMTHVWVIKRICGPFGPLERPPLHNRPLSPEERASLCKH